MHSKNEQLFYAQQWISFEDKNFFLCEIQTNKQMDGNSSSKRILKANEATEAPEKTKGTLFSGSQDARRKLSSVKLTDNAQESKHT